MTYPKRSNLPQDSLCYEHSKAIAGLVHLQDEVKDISVRIGDPGNGDAESATGIYHVLLDLCGKVSRQQSKEDIIEERVKDMEEELDQLQDKLWTSKTRAVTLLSTALVGLICGAVGAAFKGCMTDATARTEIQR